MHEAKTQGTVKSAAEKCSLNVIKTGVDLQKLKYAAKMENTVNDKSRFPKRAKENGKVHQIVKSLSNYLRRLKETI